MREPLPIIAAICLAFRAGRKSPEIARPPVRQYGPRWSPQKPPDASPEVRSYLEERALIVASLLARGAGEIYLGRHQVPEGRQVITRQVQNSLLRGAGLWDKLEQPEADLAGAPDGLWTVEQQNYVPVWCEQLRMMRWTSRRWAPGKIDWRFHRLPRRRKDSRRAGR
jgi:hypothetical protein